MQVAQVASEAGWRSRLTPAAASLRATGKSMQDAVARTAEVTDQRVVKPIVHQAQHAAAETRDFLSHLVEHVFLLFMPHIEEVIMRYG